MTSTTCAGIFGLTDCWMLATRDSSGNQIANPSKFPDGFKAVADFIHSLNLSSGLYTAKGVNTCAGYAASCGHEWQDALQWASWGKLQLRPRRSALGRLASRVQELTT